MQQKYTSPYPKQSEIAAFIRRLHEKTEAIIHNKRRGLDERHNAFINYCVILLSYCTGHRPVIDMFCYPDYFDTDAGLVLINDKVINEKYAYRLVALPELAVQQLAEYRQYITNLQRTLIRKGKQYHDLAAAIGTIYNDESPVVPQFFYLDADLTQTRSVKPSALQAWLQDISCFPVNFGRHVLATEMLKTRGMAENVEIQLGHIESGDHPFGAVSEKTPIETLSRINDEINKINQRLGWRLMPSPIRRISKKGIVNNKTIRRRSRLQAIHENMKFGEAIRETKRNQRFEKYAELITRVIGGKSELRNITEKDQQQIDGMVNEISHAATESGMDRDYALAVFYRWLWMVYRKRNKPIWLTRRAFVRDEASPFNKETLQKYKTVKKLRQGFLNYLKQQQLNHSPVSPERRLAEITLSAALFEYIGSVESLRDVPNAVINHCYCHSYNNHQQLFIDLVATKAKQNEKKRNVFRWHPGSLSVSLIAGLYATMQAGKKEQSEAIPSVRVVSSIRAILNEMGVANPNISRKRKAAS